MIEFGWWLQHVGLFLTVGFFSICILQFVAMLMAKQFTWNYASTSYYFVPTIPVSCGNGLNVVRYSSLEWNNEQVAFSVRDNYPLWWFRVINFIYFSIVPMKSRSWRCSKQKIKEAGISFYSAHVKFPTRIDFILH